MANNETIFERVSIWLCNIRSDRYAHLLVSLLLTFIVGMSLTLIVGTGRAGCALIGALVAMCVGIAKEWFDSTRPGNCFDTTDLLADAIGCLMGFVVTAL